MGASVGTSIMPGIGTGIGAAAGTIIGGVAGMVTGNKKAKHINKRISSKNNRSAASRRAMENIAESAEFASETPQYLANGGFVEGKGGPTSDSNPASLEPGSFVIPSISGSENSEIGSIVKTIAKTIGEKKPLKRSGAWVVAETCWASPNMITDVGRCTTEMLRPGTLLCLNSTGWAE